MRINGYIITLALLLIASCKQDYDTVLEGSLARKPYVPVVVENISTIVDAIPLYAIGRVASANEVKLSFKTGGYIRSMSADEGRYVRAGNVLAHLRTEEIDAQVLKARQGVDKAARDLERITAMYEDSVATYEAVQNLTTQVEVSRADLKVAEFNRQYSTITSPISGRVLRRLAEPNELVVPGQPIFMIASSGEGSYVMSVDISDKDIDLINLRTKAEVTFDAFTGKVFRGSVNKISEVAHPMTGTFAVEIAIDQGEQRLRHGMIGKVTLLPDTPSDYLKIPIESIAEGEGNQVVVYIPTEADTIARRLTVDLARYGDDFAWIDSSTLDSDRIITTGSAYLSDGQRIKVVSKK